METKPNANRLFDVVKGEAKIHSDVELAKMLGITPSQLCNIRAGRVTLGPAIMVRLMEAHPISLPRIKELLNEVSK